MKQHVAVTVYKRWVNRDPQPIILPVSSSARRSLPLANDVTLVFPSRSRARVCRACFVSVDADACFCGMCGNQL